jgi:hypothetical protein
MIVLRRFSPTRRGQECSKKEARLPVPGSYRYAVPPSSSRESHLLPKWFNVAGPGRQNGTKFKSTCLALNTQGAYSHSL